MNIEIIGVILIIMFLGMVFLNGRKGQKPHVHDENCKHDHDHDGAGGCCGGRH